MFRSLMVGGSLLRLTPAFFDGDLDNSENPPKPDDKKPDDKKWVPTPEQQAEINRIAAAERRDAEEKARQKIEAELAEQKREEDEKRQRDEAEKRGEFDKVKSDLEGKLGTAENRAKTAEEEAKFLRTFVDNTLEREIESIPEVIRAFDPGPEADIKTRMDWLEKAREQADKLEEPSTGRPAGARPPLGRPQGGGPDKEDTKKQVRRSMRGRSI